MRPIGRSIVALLAGFSSTVLAFLGLGIAVERFTNVLVVPWHSLQLDTPSSFLLVSARLFISVVVGAFVASWLSRERKVGHALVLGLLMLVLALLDGAPPESVQPLWFTVVQLVLLVPAAFCGGLGVLWVRRLRAA